ncbi:hypothetical protein [Orientia tsutsugamushi]|uniref:Uncharacterized protein n=1 Tax=Orientia tsutsugamushi TaxID=784 RepID=A0A2U3RN23_ORITS|nr:hypothetical protein [Orientia tsutsugamushi]KJV55874.1 hypothetical protein OTSKARP_0633 [Orientia tsutsugamushi str. Karp]SPR14644.1 Uncharacterised protein [Orientia tsutsugamushi]
MKDIYSAVVSTVNNITSNFSNVRTCLLSPRVRQLFVKSTNKVMEYYEICNSIFVNYPPEDSYNNKDIKVLYHLRNCGRQTCLDHPSLIIPGDLTSGINGKGIVVTGLFNNTRDNNSLYDRLQEWSEGTCKIIPNCNVERIVENIQNMMDDSENTAETSIAAGAGAAAGVAVGVIATALIVFFFCRSKKNDCVVVKKYIDENTNPSNLMEKDSTNGDNMIIHQHHDNIHDLIYDEVIGSSAKDTTAATVEMSYV